MTFGYLLQHKNLPTNSYSCGYHNIRPYSRLSATFLLGLLFVYLFSL